MKDKNDEIKDVEVHEKKENKKEPEDVLVETQHTIHIDGEKIEYSVTTGIMILKEEQSDRDKEAEDAKPKASFFFVAYTLNNVEDKSKRPITFAYNGGPGSSSVWLHLGMVGPRRVHMSDEGFMPKPPFTLVDNAFSMLDATDLVFIDPVSTGYSRPVEGQKAREFHGFKRDIESVGEFIRLYTTRYQRWTSPKFLMGESYGTTRSAGLSGYLQDRFGMYLNGIMLVSSILDFKTAKFDPGNDLPYILFLPTYAATAHYHGKVNTRKSLKTLLKEVEEFSAGEYSLALAKGWSISNLEKEEIAEKLSGFIGLEKDYILRSNLRIEIFRFTKELLRVEGRTVGRLDTRFKGIDRDSVGENFEFDPSMVAIAGPYTATLYDYIRGELNYESDLPYEILNGKVWPWSYAENENQYVNVAETLRRSMNINPYLKVHVANGYYDLATPYFATKYTFDHLGLDASLKDNISMSYYPAGHMMYIQLKSLEVLKTRLVEFIKDAIE
ncbi:S10 family peptidase [Chloroflexota bacterium]